HWVTVEGVQETGEYETVYNLRIADYHTYFVGARAWGFSVWAHNSYLDDAIKFAKTQGGLIGHLDPTSNTYDFVKRSLLAGDHILPREAVAQIIKAFEAQNGKLSNTQFREIQKIVNSQVNLRTMLSGYNSSKGWRNISEWLRTPLGRGVDPHYLTTVDAIQRRVSKDIMKVMYNTKDLTGKRNWFED